MVEKKKIAKEKLTPFFHCLLDTYGVIAPVEVDGVTLFKQVDCAQDVSLHYQNTVVPPKDWFFAQTEELFTFENTLTELEIQESQPLTGQYVLFGVRPCDLQSIALLDTVFLGDVSGEPYTDSHYQKKREQTTIIGLSCQDPLPSCFCTSFGFSPMSHDQADLMLTEIQGEYLVEVVTEKGAQLIHQCSSLFEEALEVDTKELAQELEDRTMNLNIDHVYQDLPRLFESPYWEELAQGCLGCGICTYVCPTCHCFDLSDESTGQKGRRIRTWDSCMYSNFTLMTSGENPRPSQKERVRQRFFHKLRYFQERYHQSLCVGCGRCIVKCPVNIDISQIISQVKELA